MSKGYYTGDERVLVADQEDEKLLNAFYKKYCGDGEFDFMDGSRFIYPLVAYMVVGEWGFNSGRYITGDELTVKDFLAKYEPKKLAYESENITTKADVDELRSMGTVETKPSTEWTNSHYDNYYQLTEEDIEAGEIRVDAYFVNRMWKINSFDSTGAAFHSIKTYARMANNKNTKEREIKALYGQVKRWAELEGIKLD